MGNASVFQVLYRRVAEENHVGSELGEIEGKVLCDVHTTQEIAR